MTAKRLRVTMATRERVWERFGAGSSERCVFNLDPYDTMEMILSDEAQR